MPDAGRVVGAAADKRSAVGTERRCMNRARVDHGRADRQPRSRRPNVHGPAFPSQGKCRIAAFSSDGRSIVITSFEGFAQLYDAATGRPIGQPMRHGNIRVATFSPDGRRLLTATYEGTARLWNADNGEPVSPPLVHGG
jgi:WD40 repeat protein